MVKINGDVVIAKIKGESDLKICYTRSFDKLHDLVTGETYSLWTQVEKYLVFDCLNSLKGLADKELDKDGIKKLYDYIQTDKIKKEFNSEFEDDMDYFFD